VGDHSPYADSKEVRLSAFAERFIGKLGSRSETSISAKNSFVTSSERRSITEPDRVAPVLSHCSSLKPQARLRAASYLLSVRQPNLISEIPSESLRFPWSD
jgi:hypothetical protein